MLPSPETVPNLVCHFKGSVQYYWDSLGLFGNIGKEYGMQTGQIKRVGNCWLLRYWETVIENGKTVRRRKAQKLATYSREFRTEDDVRSLADVILAQCTTLAYYGRQNRSLEENPSEREMRRAAEAAESLTASTPPPVVHRTPIVPGCSLILSRRRYPPSLEN